MDEQSDVFSQLFVRCLESDSGSSEVDLEIILDDLLKLNYTKRIFAITRTIAGEVLCHFAINTKLTSTKNEFLLNKYFQLIVQLTSSQGIVLEPHSVNKLLAMLHGLWSSCMNNPVSLQSMLDAFAAATYQNGPHISPENMSHLLQPSDQSVPSIIKTKSVDLDIRRTAVQCLAGICLLSESNETLSDENLEICLKLFIFILQDLSVAPPYDVIMCRMIFSLSKGLHNILSTSSSIHMSHIGPLLTVLKKFMVYGLPGLSDSTSDELQPIPIPELYSSKQGDEKQQDTPQTTPAKSHIKKKKRKPKTKSKPREVASPTGVVQGIEQLSFDQGQMSGVRGRPSWIRVTSSESEYSDTEGAQRAKLRSFLSKIRQMCLSVLYLTIKKTDKHTMLGYWSSFLPEYSSVMQNASSLFTSFRQDSAPKCRAAALGVVGAMLEGSRWYLSFAAEETGSPSQHATSSFVPFSVSLAASIREIHKQLLSTSSREQSSMALTQLLKTLSTLVSNTPYRKMKPGLLVKVSSQARYFLTTSRDLNVKVASLVLLGAVTSTSAPMGEVASILTDSTPLYATRQSNSGNHTPVLPTSGNHTPVLPTSGNHTPVENREISGNSGFGSWLIDQCVMIATQTRRVPAQGSSQYTEVDQSEVPLPLRVEALQTLTKITKGYLPVVKDYINTIGDVVCQCLEDSTPQVRVNAGKLLEELGSSLLQMMKSSPSKAIEDESLNLWIKVLQGPLQAVMQDRSSPVLQGKGCDSLSNIGPLVFPRLPKNLQIFCLTLLLGFTSDENALVRAPAVRALGVYVMFSTLREDIAFLEDVTNAVLRLLEDPFLIVRANAAWSLGNLTDTLVINKEMHGGFTDEFQCSLLIRMFEKAIQAINDKVKVVFNMMRVLGNLLRFSDTNYLKNQKFEELMLKSTNILADMVAGDVMVKVRWNACTACSNFLRNKELLLGNTKWTDHIYQALCNSVTSCKNFKVRIKAALALSTPVKRDQFGSMFSEIYRSLIHGFEDSDMAANFTEYKFRDTLQEQLCTTLVHLTTMIRPEDVPTICRNLSGISENINHHLTIYRDKLLLKLENDLISSSVSGDQSSMTADPSNLPAANNYTEQPAMEKINGHTSMTCDQSSVTNGQAVVVSDPVEEYIVAKQLSPKQKLENLQLACDLISIVTNSAPDPNDNSIQPSDISINNKISHDPNLLCNLFKFTENE
uniref:HEAT repeat-containing protein 6-like isoform X1 n=1 Tax=Styela clava TaxID=7725 RepID=UPI0019393EC3|nr:HEAT repeat-containing protein 6-like isoform X1 [Styela clava]